MGLLLVPAEGVGCRAEAELPLEVGEPGIHRHHEAKDLCLLRENQVQAGVCQRD